MKYKFDRTRPQSWSSISSFEYDPEEWFKKYILGERPEESREMKFGKDFALSIEDGTCDEKYGIKLLPLLPAKKEHPFKVVFDKIPLVGYADAFCDKTFKKLGEVKTGKKAWDQKRADTHGQIDMYLLMNYITNKVRPEDVECAIHWLQTQDNGDFSISFVNPMKIRTFKVKKTMQDVLAFGSRVKKVYAAMEKYVSEHE